MSIDPETLRQIEELSHDPRPLLVLDVELDVINDGHGGRQFADSGFRSLGVGALARLWGFPSNVDPFVPLPFAAGNDHPAAGR